MKRLPQKTATNHQQNTNIKFANQQLPVVLPEESAKHRIASNTRDNSTDLLQL